MGRRPNRSTPVAGAGLLLTGLGLVGYVAGIVVEYPGRAFAVTAVMVGITLIAVATATGSEGEP